MARECAGCPLEYVEVDTLCETYCDDMEEFKEVVHAHWIEGQTDNPKIHNILCSHCFEGYSSKGHSNSQYTKDKFKWCPFCGAKMDENERKLKYADENTMMSAT